MQKILSGSESSGPEDSLCFRLCELRWNGVQESADVWESDGMCDDAEGRWVGVDVTLLIFWVGGLAVYHHVSFWRLTRLLARASDSSLLSWRRTGGSWLGTGALDEALNMTTEAVKFLIEVKNGDEWAVWSGELGVDLADKFCC
jgi:hypothetical protein